MPSIYSFYARHPARGWDGGERPCYLALVSKPQLASWDFAQWLTGEVIGVTVSLRAGT